MEEIVEEYYPNGPRHFLYVLKNGQEYGIEQMWLNDGRRRWIQQNKNDLVHGFDITFNYES